MWTSNVRDSEYNTQTICLTYMYVYTPDYTAYYMYYKSMPLPLGIYPGGRRDLAAVYWREESKKWSNKLSLRARAVFMQLLG